MNIDAIAVGPRHRSDLGDIETLAQNIAEIGLLHPIVVTSTGELIAGYRRLAACRSLGWADVPVTTLALDDLLKGEWAENEMRKDFTLKEKLAIGAALEVHVRAQAKEREWAGVKQPSDKVSEGRKGDTREIVAAAVGLGSTTYEKALQVQRAAEADPESFGPIAQEMHETGKVAPAHRKLIQMRPRAASKTRQAVAERHEKIVEMGKDGYRPSAIATALGVGESNVKSLLAAAGVETVEARIGSTRRIDINRVMETLIVNATPSEEAIALINADWESLDHEQFPAWEKALLAASNVYRRFAYKMKE